MGFLPDRDAHLGRVLDTQASNKWASFLSEFVTSAFLPLSWEYFFFVSLFGEINKMAHTQLYDTVLSS